MSTHDEDLSSETLASKATGKVAALVPPALATGNARYARGRELGRGGMGRVVEAIDSQFNRVVAVKELIGSAESDRRFVNEAQVTGNLEHPGIPSVYERGVDERGAPFYAMRRIKGRTLGALLEDSRSLEQRLKLLNAVVRTAQTLGYAHENGVIHRDVKPDNIIVGAYGDVVLLDWGIARRKGHSDTTVPDGATTAPDQTAFGAIVGTPAYMSPEQAAGRTDEIDERTDVFALGALLYHVLTGRMPYSGANVTEVVAAAREAAPLPVTELEPKVAPELAAICARAMTKLPQDRFRNATELAAALEAFEADAGLTRPTSKVLSLAVTAVSFAMLIFFTIGLVALINRMPAFEHVGPLAYILVAVGVAGCSLSVLEWLTRGRYHLSPLTLAFAAVSLALGFAALSGNLTAVFGTLERFADDAEKYRRVLALGVWESMGAGTLSGSLAAVQAMFWGIAARRVSSQPSSSGARTTRR